MKILIKFPTRERNEKFFAALDKYYEMANNINNIQFVITLDTDDEIMNNEEVKERLNQYKNLSYSYGLSDNKLKALNRDLEKFTDWDIIIGAADDSIPIIKGYDTIIVQKMLECFPDTDGALHFNDGYQKEGLVTLPILGKKYFERFGYIQYDGYNSFFADNEFTIIAYQLNKIKYFSDVIIEHQHYSFGFVEKDNLYQKNDLHGANDVYIFNHRQSNNFFLNT